MSEDAIFRYSSVTKPIVTAAAMSLTNTAVEGMAGTFPGELMKAVYGP